MKRISLIFSLTVLVGCASLGVEISKKNNHIQMPSYSFVVPSDNGWHIQKPGKINELAIIANKIGPFTFQMKMMKNVILGENMKGATAEEVADDYRGLEKRIMIEQGVNKGLYELKDVTMGEETLGNKNFYTMKYVIVSKSGTQRANLYLYFPESKNNKYFIVAHYSETIPANAFLIKSFKDDFISTIETLSLL